MALEDRGPSGQWPVVESGTPLLITSADYKPTPRRILASRRAGLLHEAIDLLVGAADVNVTLVDLEPTFGANGPEPGADIAAYLARHGAKATVIRLSSAKHSVADAPLGNMLSTRQVTFLAKRLRPQSTRRLNRNGTKVINR